MRLIDYYELFQTLEPDLTWQMIDKINGLKPVDAVPVRHGRWIDEKKGWVTDKKCSACETEIWSVGVFTDLGELKNYCPNCGAKMDGDSE